MQLLLRQDVANLGKRGDVVSVKEGYGRNFLLPRGFAVVVNPGNVKQLAEERRRITVAETKRLATLSQQAEALGKVSLTIQAKANEENKLFGSVGPAEIVAALKAENFEIDPSTIALDKPVKELGVFEVKIQLAPDVAATVKVWVVGE
jgi:large subunit ribosomal protein L9